MWYKWKLDNFCEKYLEGMALTHPIPLPLSSQLEMDKMTESLVEFSVSADLGNGGHAQKIIKEEETWSSALGYTDKPWINSF